MLSLGSHLAPERVAVSITERPRVAMVINAADLRLNFRREVSI